MSQRRYADPKNITPLHRLRTKSHSRMRDYRELIRRMRIVGWDGRPLLVESTGRNRFQAWTGTHRLGAALHVGLRRVPIVIVNRAKWVKRWGEPKELMIDEVDDDFDRYDALFKAGDRPAARVIHQEIELNLSGDGQDCL